MPTLQIENLLLKLKNHYLHRALTWQAEQGQIWGILGLNGCGKTTLLLTITGLQQAKSGNIFYNNTKINQITPRSLAKIRGLMSQKTIFNFPQTTWDYCIQRLYPYRNFWQKKYDQKQLNQINSALLANNLLDKNQQCITTLSGGELQRLAFAALLIQNPKIFLLDEPFNHLDIKHSNLLQQQILKLAKEKQKCIIITTHDLQIVKNLCTHILMLQKEQTILGPKEIIFTNQNLTKTYECKVII